LLNFTVLLSTTSFALLSHEISYLYTAAEGNWYEHVAVVLTNLGKKGQRKKRPLVEKMST